MPVKKEERKLLSEADVASIDESKASSAPPVISKRSRENSSTKCKVCTARLAKKGCSQFACLYCCSDTDCEGHRESREQTKWKQLVLTGATIEQKKAAQKRSHSIVERSFREKSFVYVNQTILLWSLNEFMNHPKWREDAIRRAEKRKCYSNMDKTPILKNSRPRFRALLETLYIESIQK